ncbi:MAG: NUDIX domain-containing protein [Povalibacter sp.]
MQSKLLSTTPIYKGRVIEVNVERVELPNGNVADLEMIHHPGGAAVVAINDRNEICLLHQFRHAAQGWLWELPAGKIDNREPPIETAHRELAEEAGCVADRWDSLGHVLSSPGVFTEVVHLFLATELKAIGSAHEEHEVMEIHWKPLNEATQMAIDGEIRDGKSVVGILRAAACFTSR